MEMKQKEEKDRGRMSERSSTYLKEEEEEDIQKYRGIKDLPIHRTFSEQKTAKEAQ